VWKRLRLGFAVRVPVARLFIHTLALFFTARHGSGTHSLPKWLSTDFEKHTPTQFADIHEDFSSSVHDQVFKITPHSRCPATPAFLLPGSGEPLLQEEAIHISTAIFSNSCFRSHQINCLDLVNAGLSCVAHLWKLFHKNS